MTTAAMERETLSQIVRDLPDDKVTFALKIIRNIEDFSLEEPPLNEDEEDGLRIADAEFARKEGRSFKEALRELW